MQFRVIVVTDTARPPAVTNPQTGPITIQLASVQCNYPKPHIKKCYCCYEATAARRRDVSRKLFPLNV